MLHGISGPNESGTLLEKASSLEELLARHDREYSAFKLLSDPEKARQQIRWLANYKTNTWQFLTDCVYTKDQVDASHPIKPFPADLRYVQFLVKLWLKEKRIAVPKSRRMFCSWSFIAAYTHDTMFNEGRFNGFVSKKEDDASELVERAEFIFNKIPEWRIPRALLPAIKNGRMSKQPPTLEFEDIHSKIQGFPQGADQLRQFTLSGILGDECAFWDEAQKFYSASTPTLEGGGRMTLISSRSPGFFKKIVFDKLDSQDLTFKEQAPAPVSKPLEGIELWRNPQNKFVVVDLHYTANPAKRGKEWREAVRASLPLRDFLMEYEKSWQTFEGKPVYADFKAGWHSMPGTIEPEMHKPLIICVDFGLTPAMLICQLIGNQLRIMEEFLESDGSIKKLSALVWKHLRMHYEEWTRSESTREMIKCYIDPAGFKRVETDERTCAGIMRENGFQTILPGPVDWESRKGAVEDFLIHAYKGEPSLLISEARCPILIEGFNGGYQYPEKAFDIEPTLIRPIKNKFSHPHDALQYGCFGAMGIAKKYGFDIAIPNAAKTRETSHGYRKIN